LIILFYSLLIVKFTSIPIMSKITLELELDFVKKILQSQRFIRLIKFSLSNLIQKLIDELKFDPSSFFSGNKDRFGSIGHVIDKSDLEKKLMYILSNESTIREKVNSLTTSIVNGSDSSEKNKINTYLLYEYIIKTADDTKQQNTSQSVLLPGQSSGNTWIHKRFEQINKLTKSGDLDKKDLTHLWAPIYLLYSSYRKKSDLTKQLLNKSDDFSREVHGINQSDLIEPLSDFEKRFLKLDNDDLKQQKKLNILTGKYIYKDSIHLLPEYLSSDSDRDKSIVIGGISGHTFLLLELALLMNVKWTPILFGCIISQVPHHHSVCEIVDAIKEMGLINHLLSSNKHMSHLEIVNELAKTIGIYL
jgi:hypothetical protein